MDEFIIPSYDFGNYATGPEDAKFPELWEGLAGGWFPSKGPTGLILHDITGQNPGTLTNMDAATDWIVGEKGYVLGYGGTDEYVSIDDFDDSGAQLSVFAWAKGASQDNKRIASHNEPPANFTWIMGSGQDAFGVGDKLMCAILELNASAFKQYESSITVLDGSLHHVGFTFNAGIFKLYIDGVEDTAVNKRTDDVITAIPNSNVDVLIGAQSPSGPTQLFTGQIGDVVMWSIAQSPNVIQKLAAGASPLIRMLRTTFFVPPTLLMMNNNLHGNLQELNGGLM